MTALTIGANEAGQRFDKFLLKYLNNADKGFIYRMLRKKNITLNGCKAEGSAILREGDEVKLFLSDETLNKFRKISARRETGMSLAPFIISEDEDTIFFTKPAGILSQRADGGDLSANDMLLDYLKLSEEELRAFTPSVCNRLDRNTSGLMTAGKTLKGLQGLSELFRNRKLGKYYLAIVSGVYSGPERVVRYLKKDPDTNTVRISVTPADGFDRVETGFHIICRSDSASLLKVALYTGKTHQIRAVLADLGHPVVGDPKYGRGMTYRAGRQMLHSYRIEIPEGVGTLPNLQGRTFVSPPPEDFRRCLKALSLEPGE